MQSYNIEMYKLVTKANYSRNLYSKLEKNFLPKNCKYFCNEKNSPQSESLPSQADVIIAGGGVIACSIAYHLANQGVTNVLVLEKEKSTFYNIQQPFLTFALCFHEIHNLYLII